MIRSFRVAVLAAGVLLAQNPFEVAPRNYKLAFENDWVRVVEVTYGAHDKTPMHDHPANPAVYVYVTDGGQLRISHADGPVMVRPPVKAGGVRFNRGNVEKHVVENLGDTASKYLRIELKTEPLDLPAQDVRLQAEPHGADANLEKVQFENGQIRIVRAACAPHGTCLAREHSGDPAVVVSVASGDARWVESGLSGPVENTGDRVIEQIRIELKSKPVRPHAKL